MTKEIKVAVFVIGMIVIAIFGGRFLKGKGVFDTTNTYYVVFEEIGALYTSDPVVINGFPVGRMGEFELISEGEDRGKILAEMIVNEDVEIPLNSTATLYAADLLGEMAVKLEYSDEMTMHQDGDYIDAKMEADMIGALTQELTPLTDQLNATLANINLLFDFEKQNKQSLNYTIENLNKTMTTYNELGVTLNKNLGSSMESLDKMLANLESTTSTLNENEENLSAILTNVKDLTAGLNDADLKGTIDNVNTTLDGLNGVLAKTESTDNTLGAILNDRALYDNFEQASVDLDLLLKDVRIHPQRYINISVFGKKDKSGPLLGEDEVIVE